MQCLWYAGVNEVRQLSRDPLLLPRASNLRLAEAQNTVQENIWRKEIDYSHLIMQMLLSLVYRTDLVVIAASILGCFTVAVVSWGVLRSGDINKKNN